jgi:hypothetical protein
MSDTTLRPAAVDDAAEIHTLLLRLAASIPLAVETLEQEEALYAQLRKTLAWGESWVAEKEGRIVGCVLVDNVQTGRHWGENETLDLRYAAGEALDALIGKVLERSAPITAIVKDTNHTDLAALLGRLAFQAVAAPGGEHRFRRDP